MKRTESKEIVALLFSDFKGYSKLTEDRLKIEVDHINEELKRNYLTPENHIFHNTWGDAFYICSRSYSDLAEIALHFRDYVQTLNWQERGFPNDLKIRIALHTSEVRILREGGQIKNVVGVGVDKTARIEPVTPPNVVYCSRAFYDHLSSLPHSNFLCYEQGEQPLAKNYGTMELFSVQWKHEGQPVNNSENTSNQKDAEEKVSRVPTSFPKDSEQANNETPQTIHPIWQESDLHVERCISRSLRRYQEDSDTFIPLFLRGDSANLPNIHVIPATLLWSHRGPIQDMPDGQLDSQSTIEGKAALLTEVVDKRSILVLRGDPGTGKTTSCRFLVHRQAQEFYSAQKDDLILPLPVFVELKRFQLEAGEEPFSALAKLIAWSLRENGALFPEYQPDTKDGKRWLAQAEHEHPLALYLDGLNEVPAAFKNQAEIALKQLAENLRGTQSRIVITTRRYGFETWKLNLHVYDLQPLQEAAILQYLQIRLEWDTERVETLYNEQLGARLRLQSSNPLLLNLLCEVLRQNPDHLPTSRAILFRTFVQGLLERWEQDAKDSDFGQRNFSPKEKQQTLERLAFHMQTAGRVVPLVETQRLFSEVLNLPSEQARLLLEEICTNELLIQRNDAVEFSHHTLQEYFCASALYHRWKQEPTPGKLDWTPDFHQALKDVHWWEPLAMAGGLFNNNELEHLVQQTSDKPILTGMILGNASPRTPGEFSFLRHAASQVKSGIWLSILLTQAMLVCITSVCAAITAGGWWIKNHGGFGWWLSVMKVDRLEGIPVFLGLGGVVCAISLGIWRINYFSDTLRAQHDKLLNYCYARWLEPWLLALFYTHSETSEKQLEQLLGEYGTRRFIDESLRARLRAFTTRALNQEIDVLLGQLDQAHKRTTTIAILSLDFDPVLAQELLQNLSSQSPSRQRAEIMLYQEWIQRHEMARTGQKGESFLQTLENFVHNRNQNYVLRRELAKVLRNSGYSQIRVEWNFAWIEHLVKTIFKSVLALPKIPQYMWCGIMSIPYVVIELILASPIDIFPKLKDKLERVYINILSWFTPLILFPLSRPLPKISVKVLHAKIKILTLKNESIKAERLAHYSLKHFPNVGRSWKILIDLLIDTKRVDEAEKLLEQALQKFPKDIDLLISKGNLVYNYFEDYPKAIQAYRSALELEPDSAVTLSNLASSLRLNCEFEEAEQIARRALELEPDGATSWLRLINVLIDMKRIDEAESLIEQALLKFPKNTFLLVAKGNLLNNFIENYPKAIQAYRLALESEPDSAVTLINLASSLRLNGEFEEAEQVARRALKLKPDGTTSWLSLINVLIDTKRIDEAEKLLEQAVQKFPKDIGLLVSKGNLFCEVDDYPEAIQAYRFALEMKPYAAFLHRNLADSLRLNGEFEEAEQEARRTLDMEPNENISWLRLIEVLADQGKNEEAKGLLEQGLQRFPNSSELWWRQCDHLLMIGQYQTAWDNYEKARSLAAHLSPIEEERWDLSKAEILLQLGDHQQALRCLENIKEPIDSSWYAFLLTISNLHERCEITDDPLIARLSLWKQEVPISQLVVELPNLLPLPQTGFSRISRQTSLYLESQLFNRVDEKKADILLQQAQQLSQFDLQCIQALCELFINRKEIR